MSDASLEPGTTSTEPAEQVKDLLVRLVDEIVVESGVHPAGIHPARGFVRT
jgi:hypothetical protein